MLRFILFLVIAYTVLRAVRWLIKPSSPASRRVVGRDNSPSHMIRCTTCGMFVTQKSALALGGQEFCSKSCAEQRVHSA